MNKQLHDSTRSQSIRYRQRSGKLRFRRQLKSMRILTLRSMALALARRPPKTKILAQRIIKNAFNFLASFAGGAGGSEMVPLKAFQEWWAKFERRVENDPGFLERDLD